MLELVSPQPTSIPRIMDTSTKLLECNRQALQFLLISRLLPTSLCLLRSEWLLMNIFNGCLVIEIVLRVIDGRWLS